MARRVLVERRRIVPVRSEAGYVLDRKVRFVVPGIAGIEPAFAGMLDAPGECAHGVLHYVHEHDLARLDVMERSYDRRPVLVRTSTGTVEATTYVARRVVAERAPSRRYRDLLVEGAVEHGLPAPWIEWLRAHATTHHPVLGTLSERAIGWWERTRHAVGR